MSSLPRVPMLAEAERSAEREDTTLKESELPVISITCSWTKPLRIG